MLVSQSSKYTASPVMADVSVIGAGESGHRLYEHLVSESHMTAVGVAVIATAANSLNDWRSTVRPADIARFAPDSASLRALLPVLDDHRAVDPALAAEVEVMLGNLDGAREALDAFLDDCEDLSMARAAIVHARPLQMLWRPLAREFKVLIRDMELASPEPLPDLHRQNTSIIAALLGGASNGLKPCLDDGGRLYVPPLPQRRRAPRRAVLQNCIVRGPDGLQTGFVRDASAGGLGLGRISGLRRGDRIRVDLANGRQFSGTVAWVTGSSAGLRFDVALSPNDYMIAI